jgi:hypothetical protein
LETAVEQWIEAEERRMASWGLTRSLIHGGLRTMKRDGVSPDDRRPWWFLGAILTGLGVGGLGYAVVVRPVPALGLPLWSALVFGAIMVVVASAERRVWIRVAWLIGPAYLVAEGMAGRWLPMGTTGVLSSLLWVAQGLCFLWGSRDSAGPAAHYGGTAVALGAAIVRAAVLHQWDRVLRIHGSA